MAAFFFGSLLTDEFARYRYALAREAAAQTEQGTGPEILPARLTFHRMSELMAITLPAALTIPATKATARKSDNSFEFLFERKMFGRLCQTLTVASDEGSTRLRRSIENEDFPLMWKCFFAESFGAGYQVLPTYRSLMANIATVCAGVELFLYQIWGTKDAEEFVRDARKIYTSLDIEIISRLAQRVGVSPGVALAANVQLGGRKGSAAVAAALLKGNWDPLHEALWSPILPDFRTHPFYALFLGKTQDPNIKGVRGRPVIGPLGPPPPPVAPPPSPRQAVAPAPAPLVLLAAPGKVEPEPVAPKPSAVGSEISPNLPKPGGLFRKKEGL